MHIFCLPANTCKISKANFYLYIYSFCTKAVYSPETIFIAPGVQNGFGTHKRKFQNVDFFVITDAVQEFANRPDWSGSVGGASFSKVKGCGLIPSQGPRLCCGFSPQSGHLCEATDQCSSLTVMFLSLSFSLPPPLSKNKIFKKNCQQTKINHIQVHISIKDIYSSCSPRD